MNPSFVRRVKYACGRGDTIHAVPGLDSEVAIGVALAALEERGQWTPPTSDYPRDADVLATVALLRKHAPEIFVEPPPPRRAFSVVHRDPASIVRDPRGVRR